MNDIEDNRHYLAESSPVTYSTPATDTNMAGGKPKAKRKKKQGSTLAISGTGDEGNRSAPPTASESPVDEEKLLQTLSKREPEQFGYYDSASDESDDEDDKGEVFYSTRWPAGSRMGAKSEISEDLPYQEASENGSPAQVESSHHVENLVESQHATEEASDPGDELVEDPASPPAVNEIPSDHDTTNGDAAESNIQGWKRFPCPYAEEHGCNAMFSSKKSATRHGEGHKISFTCPVCQKVLKRQDTFDRHVKKHPTEQTLAAQTADQETTASAEEVNDTNEANGAEKSVAADEMDLDPQEPGLDQAQRYGCPRAASLGCEKTYTDPHNAKYHAKSHTSDLSCPLGCIDDKTQAIMTFATEHTRKRHMKRRHTRKARKALRVAEQHAQGWESTSNVEDTQLEKVDGRTQDPKEWEENMAIENVVHEAHAEPQPEEDGPAVDDYDGANLSDARHNLDEEDAGSPIGVDVAMEPSAQNELNGPEVGGQLERGTQDDKPEIQFSEETSKKRKRREQASSPTAGTKNSVKKRKRQSETIPRSLDEEVDNGGTGSNFVGVFIGTPGKSHRNESLLPKERRQSTINKFAQPYTAGSKLRHPLFHPVSPEKRQLGQSAPSDVGLDHNDNVTAAQNNRRATEPRGVSSPKGKERAASVDRIRGGQEIADTVRANEVADGPWPASKPRPRMSSRKDMFDLGDSDQGPEIDAESDDAKKGHQGAATPRGLVCRVCKRVYKNQRRLNRHMNDPKSHQNLLECEDCDEKFYHSGALTKHKKTTGHAQGAEDETARGRFTEHEESSIKRWVRSFCQEHDLTRTEFNQVMQASFRRDIEWRYPFMSKQDFTDEYFGVLPNRDKTSMRRYRNGKFNTTDTSNIWSKEEDETIIELHEALGPRWNRIGREMDRPGELVRQRWKFKLQTANMESGFWTKPEESAFIDAVQEVRAVSSVSSSSFNWTAVSKIMGTRTPQQCANHWRAKYAGTKKGDAWKTLGDIKPATTPIASRSKMEQRLAGKLQSSPRMSSVKSKMYVKESDDEGDVEAAKDDDTDEENSRSRKSAARKPKSRRKSTKSEDEDEEDITRPPKSDSEQEAADDEAENPRAHESEADSDEDDDQDKEAKLPRNPLAGITPGKTLTASQTFNQTQANTSAKRFSARKDSREPSQERPSPPISIRHHRAQSPELGTPDSELNDVEANDGDSGDDASSEDLGSNKENVPQHRGKLDNASTSDEEAAAQTEHEVKVQLVNSEAEETSASESEDDNASIAPGSGSRLKSQTGPAMRASSSASASRAQETLTSGSDSETGSGSASESQSEADSEPTSPHTHQKSTPSNKKLAQVSNDFMSSIHEASQRRKQQVRKPPSKWMDGSSEDEDDGRDASQTLPPMSRRR